jgi:hypothetical protein
MQKLRLEFFGDGPRLDDLSGQSGAFPSRGRESLRCKSAGLNLLRTRFDIDK